MTTTELILDFRDLLSYDLDGYRGAVADLSDAQVVKTLNAALMEIGEMAYLLHPSITLTLQAVAPCRLNLRDTTTPVVSAKVVQPLRVVIAGNLLRRADGGKPGTWTLVELENNYPNWRTDAAGTPTKAIYQDRHLILHPAPTSGIVSAGNSYISGQYLPAPLSAASGSAEPDIPDELHEWLAKLAAEKEARPRATDASQLQTINEWRNGAVAKAQAIAKQNQRTSAAWGSTTYSQGDRFIRV